MNSGAAFLVCRNLLVQLCSLLVREVGEMHGDLVSKPLADLLERQALCLWEIVPDERDVDRGEDDEEEIILPADLGERGRRGLQIGDGREEQTSHAERQAARADVGGKDLRTIDVGVGVDATTVAF